MTEQSSSKPEKPFAVTPPALNLPKGGGAIRGIGEKFATNPVTGTGSFVIPLSTSPGRADFGPQLTLSYDSGAGNGPFGFGWNLSLPVITRKTDKGLPRYFDESDSDTYVLSGAEDLVPVLQKDGDEWQRDPVERVVNGISYRIERYRPRVEGLFARIERWVNLDNSTDVHWRSISKDNLLTLFGKDANSRIFDPHDPRRIFTWLICETRDDKGNAILYDYKPEDGAGVDFSMAHQKNRGTVNAPERTANRYLKHVRYGNRLPLLDDMGHRPFLLTTNQIQNAGWMFEVVLDYGEHETDTPTPHNVGAWNYRTDSFSSYRAGFEIRTCRLCKRVLMFHHFSDEAGVGQNCLVRSTDFTYSHEQNPANARNPIYTFLLAVTQSGYRRDNGGYLKRSLPPVEFEYTQPIVQENVETVDAKSLENLPAGVDGAIYQWVDLHGEGIPGILTEQANAWYYKRNLSPLVPGGVEFAPVEKIALQPNLTMANGAQFMDLAGDGLPDLVVLDGPMPGLYEHDEAEGWNPFRPFNFPLAREFSDPNLKMVDLNGDGHPDLLLTEEEAFLWHPSMPEEGFGPAYRVAQAPDEEEGPRLIFADGTQTIYLTDFSGDGLTDLARIRNGEVCYWPNLGYGRFGAKVTMDNAPWFDAPDQFDASRLRLADIDGSGTTDLIYLHRDGVRLYFNQSGNGWSMAQPLPVFPEVNDLSNIVATDLLGNGTACLVWSSPLPGNTHQPMRYINLMGGEKPHLLVKMVNNLGAETHVHYAPSTKFYLQDQREGTPWFTRLPFPVHVVEQVETYDQVSRNRVVTRYAYHHGYFDGVEREFRGFGRVDQWDTESFAALTTEGNLPVGENIDAASHIPPVLTKSWFHLGAFFEGYPFSRLFEQEYYREGDPMLGESALSDEQFQAMLLSDTILPGELSSEEIRQAYRALKGAILRQEIYALDGTEASDRPYLVKEQNYTLQTLQPCGENRHAVFFTHAREAIEFHYERKLFEIGGNLRADPRVSHSMTLAVDAFGNVLEAVTIGYGRRQDNPDPLLTFADRQKQRKNHLTFSENRNTNVVDTEDVYRTPLLCETCTYELHQVTPTSNLPGITNLFRFDEMVQRIQEASDGAHDLPYADVLAGGATEAHPYRRLVEQIRVLYRKDDLSGFLPLGQVESLALSGESYKLAFTPDLLSAVYRRGAENLLSDPTAILGQEGGYLAVETLTGSGLFPANDPTETWWIPSGRMFFSPFEQPPAEERTFALATFFLPHRFQDPFGEITTLTYDPYLLFPFRTVDPLENQSEATYDYRVLQPQQVTDPNDNQTAVAFDALGMVVGMATMGKNSEILGDSLDSFNPDLTPEDVQSFFDADNPHLFAIQLLGTATARMFYDLERTPVCVATIARETHVSDLGPGQASKVQLSFGYSDGFGREIQKKIQAEPGPLVADGSDVDPRWVGSGWTIYNNKGKPVKQYEPYFSATHLFEFAVTVGVSPTLFYDPVGRVIATLHPNHTWEKVIFDPWRQESWDVNDMVLIPNPAADPDVGDYVARLPAEEYLPTWHEARITGRMGTLEREAAEKTALHAATPTVTHFDSLGRPFLVVADNGGDEKFMTRTELDIEGKPLAVSDALGRKVMVYTVEANGLQMAGYDVAGNAIYQLSMEAGARWMLPDVTGKPIRAWDSRGQTIRTQYDELRRPTLLFVQTENGAETLVQRTVYGEAQGTAGNHRTRVFHQFDTAGIVTFERYDFKGNLLEARRHFAVDYKSLPDWNEAVAMEPEGFITQTTYDALNRPVTLTTPDASILRPTYNEANLLERVEAQLRGAETLTPFVGDIDYNAKGQRERIAYGNGVTTHYTYDPLTFRLTRFHTVRGNSPLQDYSYTYDPAGNLTTIQDEAQQTIFFNNQVVEPHNHYTYDALYRLIQATGREHVGPPPSWDDAACVQLPHPNDGLALRRYEEQFEYDPAGNFLRHLHQAVNGNWTRQYAYEEPSLIEPADGSNRLSRTQIGEDVEPYTYNPHGSMTRMPHLFQMVWDYREQLQRVNLGGGGTAYYVYDGGGQRVRKVIVRQNGTRQKERYYVGGFEVYREYGGDGPLTLERETLHLMDGTNRVALIETRTVGTDDSPAQLSRYQLGNHLGSVSLELDEGGQIISYEEYYPYGCTAYQAGRSQTEVARKQYRYTGKERDEETGFTYHGARYYAPWLGRWASADPAGLVDGLNFYAFTKNNPLINSDPTGTQTEIDRNASTLEPTDPHNYPSFESYHSNAPGSFDEHVEVWHRERPNEAMEYTVRYVHPPQGPESGASGASAAPEEATVIIERYEIEILSPQGPESGASGAPSVPEQETVHNGEVTNVDPGLRAVVDTAAMLVAVGSPSGVATSVLMGASAGLAVADEDYVGAGMALASMRGGNAGNPTPMPKSAAAVPSQNGSGVPGSSNRGPFNARSYNPKATNCSECVTNFEASAQASKRVRVQLQNGEKPTSLGDHVSRLKSVGANPHVLQSVLLNQIDVEKLLVNFPAGTRFSIWANPRNGSIGHVFGGQIDSSGVVRFIETQTHGSIYWSNYSAFWIIVHNP